MPHKKVNYKHDYSNNYSLPFSVYPYPHLSLTFPFYFPLNLSPCGLVWPKWKVFQLSFMVYFHFLCPCSSLSLPLSHLRFFFIWLLPFKLWITLTLFSFSSKYSSNLLNISLNLLPFHPCTGILLFSVPLVIILSPYSHTHTHSLSPSILVWHYHSSLLSRSSPFLCSSSPDSRMPPRHILRSS